MDTEREDASKLVRYYLTYYLQIDTMKTVWCTIDYRYFIFIKIFLLPSVCDTPMIYLVSEVFTVSPVEGW